MSSHNLPPRNLLMTPKIAVFVALKKQVIGTYYDFRKLKKVGGKEGEKTRHFRRLLLLSWRFRAILE